MQTVTQEVWALLRTHSPGPFSPRKPPTTKMGAEPPPRGPRLFSNEMSLEEQRDGGPQPGVRRG